MYAKASLFGGGMTSHQCDVAGLGVWQRRRSGTSGRAVGVRSAFGASGSTGSLGCGRCSGSGSQGPAQLAWVVDDSAAAVGFG